MLDLARRFTPNAGMMTAILLTAFLMQDAAAPALADSVVPADVAADSALDSRPSDLLRAAQGAVTAGRYRQAQDALEMAETRMLDRSVPLGQTRNPSDNPVNAQIAEARRALDSHDRSACLQSIQGALQAATAQGL